MKRLDLESLGLSAKITKIIGYGFLSSDPRSDANNVTRNYKNNKVDNKQIKLEFQERDEEEMNAGYFRDEYLIDKEKKQRIKQRAAKLEIWVKEMKDWCRQE